MNADALRKAIDDRSARVGIIGCGFQAETQVACIRAAVPTLEALDVFNVRLAADGEARGFDGIRLGCASQKPKRSYERSDESR
mgnify:CR=1 FL=1